MKINFTVSKETKENTMNILKQTGKVGFAILVAVGEIAAACRSSGSSRTYYHSYSSPCGEVGYSDAVACILKSDMWSSDKRMLVNTLEQGLTSEFYKAVINIVQSDMWSSDKVKTITAIQSNE